MAQVAKEDLAGAFASAKPYTVFPAAEFDGVVTKTRTQRDQYGPRYGKTTGFEFIRQKQAGDSIVQLLYVEKTQRHALPWHFIFYKTPKGWVLNTFYWNDKIQEVFE